MSASLEQLKAPIRVELSEFEQRFAQSMKTRVPLLNTIMNYIVRRKGKQIRPIFVLYSAGLCGDIGERTYRGAALVELLHTATLVHDDVVDESYQRRGFFSVNALWKNKIAVLVGDYLLSRGLLLSIDAGDYDLLQISSRAVRDMSEGELMQLERSRFLDITEPVYFEIIRQKTASLIASCCAIGAASAGANKDLTDRFHAFGEKIGVAFQIRDDLFDFGDNDSGKPSGIDIKEKKLTLPLIHALKQVSPASAKEMLKLIKSKTPDKEKLARVTAFVNENNGMEYARSVMTQLKDEAFALLGNHASRNDLDMRALVDFVIDRKH
ncbi:MAG: polyprenyl synthetase family protein [Bacteroidia bacterium]|jgi:octaprenyl-diphosphate synthase